jgi:hypothetical protein
VKSYVDAQYKEHYYTLNAANEIEGFIFSGLDAEKRYSETGRFGIEGRQEPVLGSEGRRKDQ